MKDGELRGIVLERFYAARHQVEWFSFSALMTHVTIERTVLGNICAQLGEHGLIDWRARTSSGTATEGMGKITARGIDVVEGTAIAPITVILHDQSISVSGSSNVQIGNANRQTFKTEMSFLASAVDQMDASEHERKEAKGIIERITTNPLVVAALSQLLGKSLG
jgi:hypothetical protein